MKFEMDRDETIKALESCIVPGSAECGECPLEDVNDCEDKLKSEALRWLKDAHEHLVEAAKTAENAEAEEDADSELEQLEVKGQKFGESLKSMLNNESNENGISTLAVFAFPKVLKGIGDTKAFLGGVTVAHRGTLREMMQILYQLCKVVHKTIADDTSKGFADKIFDNFWQQIKDGKDHFDLSEYDIARTKLRSLLDMLSDMANDADKDDDDED